MFTRKKISRQFMITIPQPCSEDWEKMHALDNQHRNCDSCQITVTDFSKMSDDELVLYLKHGGRPKCGRFSASQLNRKFTALPEREVHARWWRALLLVPFSLFGKQAAAQQLDSLSMQNDSTLINPIAGDSILTPVDSMAVVAPDDSLADVVLSDTLSDGEVELRVYWEPTPATITCQPVIGGSMVLGGMGYVEENIPLHEYVLNLITPSRKKDSIVASIESTDPNNISTHNPNEKPEAPAQPMVPETPWYEAILPSIVRIKRKA